MTDTATQFLEAATVAIDLVESDPVGERWDDESVLEVYRVGALAAHLGRAVLTVRNYLEVDSPTHEAPTVDAVGYFATVLDDHDPVASDFHAGVRRRGEQAAAAGQAEVVADLRRALEQLRTVDLGADRTLAVLGSVAISLQEYLKTRLVELAVHTDDLARSVRRSPPEYRSPVWETVAEVVARTAIARNGARALALSLARTERTDRLTAF